MKRSSAPVFQPCRCSSTRCTVARSVAAVTETLQDCGLPLRPNRDVPAGNSCSSLIWGGKPMGSFLSSRELCQSSRRPSTPHSAHRSRPRWSRTASSTRCRRRRQQRGSRPGSGRWPTARRRARPDRRGFLRSSAGMAAAFLAMNEVFGPLFDVSRAEAADPGHGRRRAPRSPDQFIFDGQTAFRARRLHAGRHPRPRQVRAKHWNPALRATGGIRSTRYKFENYVKEVFLDSDTKVGAALSGAPSDDPSTCS